MMLWFRNMGRVVEPAAGWFIFSKGLCQVWPLVWLHSDYSSTKDWAQLGYWHLQGDLFTLGITSSAFSWLKQATGSTQKAWQDSMDQREERLPEHSAGPPV